MNEQLVERQNTALEEILLDSLRNTLITQMTEMMKTTENNSGK